MTRQSPTFSVITPTLDRPDFLAKAIQSVLAQTYEDWELIVYNVGGPVTIPPDPRIRYFEGERAGPAADFQAALDRASGLIVHPLADDDTLPPHALETAHQRIGDKNWLVGTTVLVNLDGYPTAIRGGRTSHIQDTLDGKYMLGGAVYWRKSLSDRLGGFDSAYDGAADFDLYTRFARDGEPAVAPEILYIHTVHPGQDSHANHARQSDASGRIAAARTR